MIQLSSRKKGIACIIASAFFFALMNVFVRLAGDLPSPEKSLFRNIIALAVAASVMLRIHQPFKWPKSAWLNLVLRSSFGTLGILCNYYAVDHLLLADASAIQKLVPFITILSSAFILKEKPKPVQVVLVAAAFACSLLIIKPSFDNANLGASLIAALGAVGAGVAYVYVRKLSLQGVDRSSIIFFFSAFSTLVLIPMVAFDFKMPTGLQFFYLIMAGVAASGGQYAVTYAYSFAPAREISIFDYSQIIFAAAFGWFIFGQQADLMSWIGYILLMLLALANTLIGLKKERA